MSDTPPFSVIAEASIHLDAAACQLYLAGQYRYPDPLPPWESRDASDMRTEARYVAAGALRRCDGTVRGVAIERLAAVLADLNGDHWPDCLNRLHAKMPEAQREAYAAMRRQRYRAWAIVAHSAVTTYYEMGNDVLSQREAIIADVRAQQAADKVTVEQYRVSRGLTEPTPMVQP